MAVCLVLFILVLFAFRVYKSIDTTNKFHLKYLFKHLLINALMLAFLLSGRIFTKESHLFMFLIFNLQILAHVYFYYHISCLIEGKKKKISNYNYIIFFVLSALFILNNFDIDLIPIDGNIKLLDPFGLKINSNKMSTDDVFLIKQLYQIGYLIFIYFKIYTLLDTKAYVKDEKAFKIWINIYLLLSIHNTLQILFLYYNPFHFSDEVLNFIIQIISGVGLLIILNYFLNPALFISTFKIKVKQIHQDTANNYLRINDLVVNDKMYLNSNVSIGKISKLLGLNESEVRSAINNSTNNNFNMYMNTLRINYCIDLLNSDYLNLSTLDSLSSECGFNSSQSFYRTFKKIKKTTPNKYYTKIKS